MPYAVIFDLDGVLVDTAPLHYRAWKRLAELIDIPFNQTDNERLKGLGRRESLEALLALGRRSASEKEIQEWMDVKNRWYVESLADLSPDDRLPGVTPLLEQLKKEGFRLAVGSASRNARMILQRVELTPYFDAVVDGTMIKRSKPAPDVFLKAAERLEVPPEQAVVIEDARAGIAAAHAASMKAIGIGDPQTLAEADLVVESLRALTADRIRALFMSTSRA